MCNCGCGLALAMAEMELKVLEAETVVTDAAPGACCAASGQAIAALPPSRGWEAIKQAMRRIVAHGRSAHVHDTATPDLTAA